MDFMSNAGLYIAVIGASLAVALACAGSGKGVGIVGEAAAGVISEDPGKFSSMPDPPDPARHSGPVRSGRLVLRAVQLWASSAAPPPL